MGDLASWDRIYFRYPAFEYDKGRAYENVTFWVEEAIHIAGLNARSSILDLGCGTGNYAIELRRKSRALVYGLDPSAELIEVGRKKELGDAINWCVGVAEALPFAPEAFDCVFASQVWHHINDKQRAAGECYRVLKRGAALIIRTFSQKQLRRKRVFEFFQEILPHQLKVYPSIGEFKEHFERTGFTSFDVRPYQLERYIPPAYFIEAAQGKLCSMFKTLSDEGLKAGVEKLRDFMNSHPDKPIRDDELITLVIACK